MSFFEILDLPVFGCSFHVLFGSRRSLRLRADFRRPGPISGIPDPSQSPPPPGEAKKRFWKKLTFLKNWFSEKNVSEKLIYGEKHVIKAYSMWTCGHVNMWTCGDVDMSTCAHVDMRTMSTSRHVDMRTWRHSDMSTCGHADMSTPGRPRTSLGRPRATPGRPKSAQIVYF